MKQNENTAWQLTCGLSIPMFHLECAADLAYCMAEGLLSGNVDDQPAGNALVALSEYLSDLHDEMDAEMEKARTRTLEDEGQLQKQPEQPEDEKRDYIEAARRQQQMQKQAHEAYIEAVRRQAFEAGRQAAERDQLALTETENT